MTKDENNRKKVLKELKLMRKNVDYAIKFLESTKGNEFGWDVMQVGSAFIGNASKIMKILKDDPSFDIIGVAQDIPSGKEMIIKEKPDVIFLHSLQRRLNFP